MTATSLGGQFVRRLPSALTDFNNGRSENPVVTYLEGKNLEAGQNLEGTLERDGVGQGLYVAVFDTLKHDPPPHGRSQQFRGFGITWSHDGLNWSSADVVDVGVGDASID